MEIENDYISRQAAIEAFEKELSAKYNRRELAIGFVGVKSILDNLPSADVVEVVRCKDCKHFELNKPYVIQGVPVLGHEVCNVWGDGCKTDQDGFCFMGERRTDGEI